ncbi:hypothetical protein SRABI26_03834 [Arthrobacter sp. Bi26]|uniref:hypothetical protein n=1 Tax=Arthrobacter sp. Bi26 TaxID=2822350 RepID=UPI001E04FDEA|nr:hypothetical protein [Arthrobacter sp. Bi26]CAH0277109.1 hypothetical protein SRABI26_03834 [Arthrobacter sp. Bi26]
MTFRPPGNFRFIDRLFTRVERVMKTNELGTITDEVIRAPSTLVKSRPTEL